MERSESSGSFERSVLFSEVPEFRIESSVCSEVVKVVKVLFVQKL